MPSMPHDVPDLFLAPVVLALDARIEELARLDLAALAREVALVSNTGDYSQDMRRTGLLRSVTYLVDCHDWAVSWDPRGIRVCHDERELVLGVPSTFAAYVMGADDRDEHQLLL